MPSAEKPGLKIGDYVRYDYPSQGELVGVVVGFRESQLIRIKFPIISDNCSVYIDWLTPATREDYLRAKALLTIKNG